MKSDKRKPDNAFPVEDGSEQAPRAERIAGIVQRVWADAKLYHEDIEPLLREWLHAEGYDVGAEEFAALLSRAEEAFADAATGRGEHDKSYCHPRDIVDHLYSDVEQLERSHFRSSDTSH